MFVVTRYVEKIHNTDAMNLTNATRISYIKWNN